MGQMASLLTNLCRRIPVSSDESPPDRKRRSSQTCTRLETRHTVESDSNESATLDEDDRSHKRRRAQEHAQTDVHASDDDSVSADINLLTEPQSQQVTDQKNENNSVLKELSDLLDEDETTGPAIQKQLAEIADKRWGAKLTPEKIKTLTERYNTPENITSMIPTKVNNEIWSLLSSAKKKMDLQLSNLQQTLRKVAISVLQTGDELLLQTTGSVNKNLASRSVDALAMLGHANSELSRLRREQIRFALHPDYAAICKADIPNGPLPFGDDLPKNLKEAKETKALGQNLRSQPKKQRTNYRAKPYNMDKRHNYAPTNNYNKGPKNQFFGEAKSTPPNEENLQRRARGND